MLFRSAQALVDRFVLDYQGSRSREVYVSIDKDVFSSDVVRTNWDQGCFELGHVRQILDVLQGHVIGSDITGEVSEYRYRTAWKRWLSSLDRQPAISPEMLTIWQAQQIAVNHELLAWLTAVSR